MGAFQLDIVAEHWAEQHRINQVVMSPSGLVVISSAFIVVNCVAIVLAVVFFAGFDGFKFSLFRFRSRVLASAFRSFSSRSKGSELPDAGLASSLFGCSFCSGSPNRLPCRG